GVPYIAPFVIFLALIGLNRLWPMAALTDEILRLAVMLAVLLLAARPLLRFRAQDFRVQSWGVSVLVGAAIFVLWIGPDLLFPQYRSLFLFNNSVVGTARSSLTEAARHDVPVLFLRTLRAVAIVPIVEELFWRGWLLRWVIHNDFEKVPLGAYTALSFWTVALLFASEHGPYWDVGLVAGIIFNWWMIRTKSLGDLILAHAVANACLSGYVIAAGKWEYWL
ncbi:MAG TPA: CAAX prenyl protease-related protein, partial [Bryobacteraceae bacterium]|nr:CAAX prenyl protease-related protein [Bryobacteraceae bacterium]